MIVVGEAVEGIEDSIGIAFAVENVVEIAGEPYLFEFISHPYVEEWQCLMPSFIDLLADDF